MSLANSLFTHIASESSRSRYHITETHDIFKGHFPQQPVLPAVTMLQLLDVEVNRQTKEELQLKNVSNAKFLSVVNPLENAVLEIETTLTSKEDVLKVSATIVQHKNIVAKLSAVYSKKTSA